MNNLLEEFRRNFADAEYRDAYAESFVNSYIAAQIKVLREEYPLTQGELGIKIGTSQPGIARFENVNYSSWKVESLRKLARALNVWLKITFEEFGSLPSDIEDFSKRTLVRRPFHKDPVFSPVVNGKAKAADSSSLQCDNIAASQSESESNSGFNERKPMATANYEQAQMRTGIGGKPQWPMNQGDTQNG